MGKHECHHRMEDDIAHFVPFVFSGNLKEEAEGKGSSKGKHKLVWEPSKHTMSNSQTNLGRLPWNSRRYELELHFLG